MSASDELADVEEQSIRHFLWNNHGCKLMARYGDDGEMSCGMCALDFKRMDLGELMLQLRRAKTTHKIEIECLICNARGETHQVFGEDRHNYNPLELCDHAKLVRPWVSGMQRDER